MGVPWRRREFLAGSASLAVLAMVDLPGCSSDNPSPPPDAAQDQAQPDSPTTHDLELDQTTQPDIYLGPPSPVVEVYDPLSVEGSTFNTERVKAMLRAGLLALAQKEEIKEAWKTLVPDFAPSLRIGIKLNCLSSYLYNSVAFVSALVETLVQDLGADPARIWVWDRRGDELERSKLTEQAVGAKVIGTVTSTTDSSGPGYETAALVVDGIETHLSRILTSETDLTINLPLLKKHTVSGITGALKNTYGCIDNPGAYHDGLVHQLPAIYALEGIKSKMQLHITEALLGVIKRDTADPPDSIPARLLLARDPVALDAHALALVNTLRQPLTPLPESKLGWIEGAARLGLGSNNPQVELVEIKS